MRHLAGPGGDPNGGICRGLVWGVRTRQTIAKIRPPSPVGSIIRRGSIITSLFRASRGALQRPVLLVVACVMGKVIEFVVGMPVRGLWHAAALTLSVSGQAVSSDSSAVPAVQDSDGRGGHGRREPRCVSVGLLGPCQLMSAVP